MEIENPTIWEKMKSKGYSRRDFLQLCSYMAAITGVGIGGLPKVVSAAEQKVRPPVVWFHFQECTCCSESFIRTSHPVVADILLDIISLNYSETLQAAAGHQAEKSLHDTMKNNKGKYIVLVEGSIPTGNNGYYCTIAGKPAKDIITEAADGAAAMIAWGNCASYGCIQAAKPNPTGAKPLQKIVSNPVINVPGCPPIGDVMAAVVAHIVVLGKMPQLDSQGRPKEFYSRRIHDTCYRRPYYDAGMFVENWDDENAKKGYCLYKMGCRGPVTYNACAVTKWNEGTSYPIQSGHGCIGCSEADFWDNGPFYQHLPAFPGFGIESTANTVGATAAVVTTAAIAGHAVATNIRKRGSIKENLEEGGNE